MTPQEKADLLAAAQDWLAKSVALQDAATLERAARDSVLVKMSSLGITKIWGFDKLLTVVDSNTLRLEDVPSVQ